MLLLNERGLMDMKNLLKDLGYNPAIYKSYKNRNVWELSVSRQSEVMRFFRHIGFSIKRKQRKLEELVRRKGLHIKNKE